MVWGARSQIYLTPCHSGPIRISTQGLCPRGTSIQTWTTSLASLSSILIWVAKCPLLVGSRAKPIFHVALVFRPGQHPLPRLSSMLLWAATCPLLLGSRAKPIFHPSRIRHRQITRNSLASSVGNESFLRELHHEEAINQHGT